MKAPSASDIRPRSGRRSGEPFWTVGPWRRPCRSCRTPVSGKLLILGLCRKCFREGKG